jgi:hypothetical protein
MKQFVIIYYAPASAMEKMKNSTPEDMKKGMEEWMKWAEKCGEHLVDLGNPLGNGQEIDQSSTSPSHKGVVGYSILQANDITKAQELLEGHPHLGWTDGCKIEIHEKLPLPNNNC